ncbi:hypothetical protein [Sphingobacterium allocomposti]|uniref:hypothetical protein n=1 Tax=Sphingobacterium allocomposti TaxID=415956 RepID=UPI001FE7A9BF|nr:hypothetical protein [Sphingobacterium composti Yoo et al. 2007 non Ten et al. 2007]HLS93964.1 hypothetical protein [Sphingobacterium sp.]
MLNKITQIAAAKLCFAIFVVKMLISATPMFVDVLDKGTVLQVVLQVEIENTAKGNSPAEDLHEAGSKFFSTTSSDYLSFCPVVENLGKQAHYLKNERLIQAYHPSVPTPPPNC